MGTFEINQIESGEYYFELKARNGQTIAMSSYYSTLAGCENAILSVRKHATDAKIKYVM